jgi:DNA polymerase-1
MRQNLVSPAGEPTKATYIFTNTLLGLIEREKPDLLVVAMDSKAPTFRKEIYEQYKANRQAMPEDMPPQIEHIEQILDAMRIPVLRLDGFEADDIIGTLSKQAQAHSHDAYICSKDKDMLQLINEHVFTYDVKTSKVTDEKTLMEEQKLTPTQFLDVLALQGDTSDNVPGVADVGPKTAGDWIRKYQSIGNLYEHIDEIRGKRGESLRKSREILDLSKKLVTIDCQVPIDIDYEEFAIKEPDKDKLAKLFTELGFTRLLSQLQLQPDESVAQFAAADLKSLKHTYDLISNAEKLKSFAEKLKKQPIFAFDTETTNIDPMRADLVGISFCFENHNACYIPVKAPLGSSTISLADVKKILGPIFADPKVKKIGQNIKYDLLVLQNSGIQVDGVYFDTMVASYCLDPQRRSHGLDAMANDFLHYTTMPITALIGKGKNQLTFDMVDTEAACQYGAEDADITWQLYGILQKELEQKPEIKKLFEEVEMPLVSVLMLMEHNGVSIDIGLLKRMSTQIADSVTELRQKIYEHAGTEFLIDSPKQLAGILFDRLGLASIERGKTGPSTNAAVLEKLADAHPIVRLILEYRQLIKLQNTYVDKLGSLVNPRTNRLHTSFNQTVTATGRLSSSDPNLQNIPIRTELGKKIRGAFITKDKDSMILSADYSQIELRLLAHFSEDQALVDAFESDTDIHAFVASQIYDVPLDQVTSQMRSRCKAVNFGIIYGQGAFGLSRTIGISQSEAKKFIEDYFARYSTIRDFMDEIIAQAEEKGYAETILGRRREVPELKSRNRNKRAQAERLVVNTTIQGSAADLIKVAMINLHNIIEEKHLPLMMTLQIHDELVFELPAEDVDKYAKLIADQMTGAIKLSVPLKVDVAIGKSWLEE